MDDGEYDWADHAELITAAQIVRYFRRALWPKLAIAALCAGAIAGAIWTRLH